MAMSVCTSDDLAISKQEVVYILETDGDFCGTQGYEILLKKLKDGRQLCKDWDHFLKERAKIEEEYAAKLQKLVKSTGGNTAMGTLLSAWECVKRNTDGIANEHILSGKEMVKASERIQNLMITHKNKRTAAEQVITKSAKAKKDLYHKVSDSKKTFHSKAIEADQAEKNVDNMKSKGGPDNMPAKDWDKMLTKSQKLKFDAGKTDESYKEYLAQLEKARQQWEKDMVFTCDEFESLEVERILFLQNELWVHTNIISQTAVDDDAHCESMRQILETCDVDKDLTEYISRNRTGSQRPAKLEYEGWGATTRKTSSDRPAHPLPHL